MSVDIELFLAKNKILGELYEEVTYKDFYRDIFPCGSFERKRKYDDQKGNGIALVLNGNDYKRVTITDELDELDYLRDNDFVILNGLSYYGNARTMKNASLLYAMIFDIDGIGSIDKLTNLISQVTNGICPLPTYIVNSGHGVHLYYVFDKPIPLYNHLKEPLKELKYYLTRKLWNMYVSDIEEIQYQGINQGFRMVGSPTKLGHEIRLKAFKSGSKVSLNYLNSFVSNELLKVEQIDYKSSMSLLEAKEKYPEWYDKRIIKGMPKDTWIVKRDLYDWWLRKISSEATYGHRYFCIMALAIYGSKCNIPYEEVERDALSLVKMMNDINPNEKFTKLDVLSALNSYDDDFKMFPRSDIEKMTAINIPKNKRNGRKQDTHLKLARGQLKILLDIGEVKVGRPSLESQVRNYIRSNPKASPTEIASNLGISRTTVYKYFK